MTEYKITGTLHRVLQLLTGSNSKGSWQVQKFVLKKDNGEYICITAKGKKVEEIPNTIGKEITVFFNPIAKENKDKWYDENVLVKVEY